VQSARHEALTSLDSRFESATVEDTDQRLGQFYRVEIKDGWWSRRLPARRLGELANDLDV
jgi:hypothetical protein